MKSSHHFILEDSVSAQMIKPINQPSLNLSQDCKKQYSEVLAHILTPAYDSDTEQLKEVKTSAQHRVEFLSTRNNDNNTQPTNHNFQFS